MPRLNRRRKIPKKSIPKEKVSEVLDTNRSINFTAYTNWGSVDIDPGRGDYDFYSRLYAGIARGYTFVWPLPRSVTSKRRAIVTNVTPRVECDDQYTSEKLSEWLKRNADVLGHLSEFSGRLGDMYAHIVPPRPDENYPTIHAIQPDVVYPLTNKKDFSLIDGWRVRITYRSHTDLDHQTITDDFLLKARYRKYSNLKNKFRFPYGIDKIPFIHIPTNVDSNSIFGRSDAEPMLAMLRQMQETYTNSFIGHRNMAIPTPVFRKMGTSEEIDDFLKRFGTNKTQQLNDGTSVTYQEYDWHAGQVTLLAGDAEMQMVSPTPFIEETRRVIDLIIQQLIIANEIPEFAYGVSVSSSDRTASEQMRAFVMWGEKQRLLSKKWLSNIVHVVMLYMASYDPKIKILPFDLSWPPLIPDNGKIRLQQLGMLLRYGVLDGVTALSVARELDPSISNPEEIFKKAQAQVISKPNPNMDGNGRSGDTASELPAMETLVEYENQAKNTCIENEIKCLLESGYSIDQSIVIAIHRCDNITGDKQDDETETIEEGMYDGIDFSITSAMSNNAKRAIERNSELPVSKRGMTDTGKRRARQLANGGDLSPLDVIQMRAWFARHTSTSRNSPNYDKREKAWVAWQGWGGDAGKRRINSIYRKMMTKNTKLKEQYARMFYEAYLLAKHW